MCAAGDQRIGNVVRPVPEQGRLGRPKAESDLFCIKRVSRAKLEEHHREHKICMSSRRLEQGPRLRRAECATSVMPPESDLDIRVRLSSNCLGCKVRVFFSEHEWICPAPPMSGKASRTIANVGRDFLRMGNALDERMKA